MQVQFTTKFHEDINRIIVHARFYHVTVYSLEFESIAKKNTSPVLITVSLCTEEVEENVAEPLGNVAPLWYSHFE